MANRFTDHQSINTLIHSFSTSDPNIIKKAIRYLQNVNLIAPLPETPVNYSEEDKPYMLTDLGRLQLEIDRKEFTYIPQQWDQTKSKKRKRKETIKFSIGVCIVFPIISLILLIVVALIVTS